MLGLDSVALDWDLTSLESDFGLSSMGPSPSVPGSTLGVISVCCVGGMVSTAPVCQKYRGRDM